MPIYGKQNASANTSKQFTVMMLVMIVPTTGSQHLTLLANMCHKELMSAHNNPLISK